MILDIGAKAGQFAENKEIAAKMRAQILRDLRSGSDGRTVLDFSGVSFATQSFVHALLAEAIRDESIDALSRLEFRSCSDSVRAIIEIVVSYAQDDWTEADSGIETDESVTLDA